jgi:formate dehydrogenase subunit gamma
MTTEPFDKDACADIVSHHDRRPERLVQILVDIVRRFGYVPADAIALLAEALNLSRAEVHGVVSYYHDFRSHPPGRHVLKICQAEACRAVGATRVAEDAQSISGLAPGESNAALTIEPAYCLGNCALGPAAMFDDKPLGRVDRTLLEKLLADCREAVS